MSRVKLTDSLMDMAVKMSEGNPGALTTITEVLSKGEEIDPQGAMGGVGAILILDTWEIYGSSIYVLWNDKCDRDTRKLLVLIRATQLGIFPQHRLKQLAEDQSRRVDLSEEEYSELDNKVCERLDGFQRPQ